MSSGINVGIPGKITGGISKGIPEEISGESRMQYLNKSQEKSLKDLLDILKVSQE